MKVILHLQNKKRLRKWLDNIFKKESVQDVMVKAFKILEFNKFHVEYQIEADRFWLEDGVDYQCAIELLEMKKIASLDLFIIPQGPLIKKSPPKPPAPEPSTTETAPNSNSKSQAKATLPVPKLILVRPNRPPPKPKVANPPKKAKEPTPPPPKKTKKPTPPPPKKAKEPTPPPPKKAKEPTRGKKSVVKPEKMEAVGAQKPKQKRQKDDRDQGLIDMSKATAEFNLLRKPEMTEKELIKLAKKVRDKFKIGKNATPPPPKPKKTPAISPEDLKKKKETESLVKEIDAVEKKEDGKEGPKKWVQGLADPTNPFANPDILLNGKRRMPPPSGPNKRRRGNDEKGESDRLEGIWDAGFKLLMDEDEPISAETLRSKFPGHGPRFSDLELLLEKYGCEGKVKKHVNDEGEVSWTSEVRPFEKWVGFDLLKKIGWDKGSGLGMKRQGILNPVKAVKKSKLGETHQDKYHQNNPWDWRRGRRGRGRRGRGRGRGRGQKRQTTFISAGILNPKALTSGENEDLEIVEVIMPKSQSDVDSADEN